MQIQIYGQALIKPTNHSSDWHFVFDIVPFKHPGLSELILKASGKERLAPLDPFQVRCAQR